MNTSFRSTVASTFKDIQDQICKALENIDGKSSFQTDLWERPNLGGGDGGGGRTRIIANGAVIEKGGVNFSEVHGLLPADFSKRIGVGETETPFFATGVSLVIHPNSPMIPTTHANWRYLEAGGFRWFGGGSDLTPYYLFEEDAKHFHSTLKFTCDRHNTDYYSRFKKWCDQYFYLPHRNETRGVGGIFFDYLGKDDGADLDKVFAFARDLGTGFVEQYVPIMERRKDLPFTPEEREFQLLRRGRYVEFNLLYDRGTQFGLQTSGRTESILMSLPPLVRWDYNPTIVPGSSEAQLLEVLTNPREWV